MATMADSPKSLKLHNKSLELLKNGYNLSMGAIQEAVKSVVICKCEHESGCKLGKPEVRNDVFIRGGVVQAWVTWEAFLGDIIRQVFRIVINSVTSAEETDCGAQLKSLELKWPLIRTIIEDQCDKQRKKNEKDKLTAFDLLVKKDSWKTHLFDFVDEAVDTMTPTFAPKGNQCGINGTFQKLFKHTKESEFLLVSNRIVNPKGNHNFQFKYWHGEADHEFDVVVVKENSLKDILRLYYGLRCAFAHGSANKTLRRGALTDFPDSSSNIMVRESRVRRERVQSQERENPEVQSPERVQSQERESPERVQSQEKESPEVQSPERVQSQERESPEIQSQERESPEVQSPERVQSQERESPEVQSPERVQSQERENPEVQDSCSGTVQESLFELYKKIERNGKEAQVTLNDLKNMISFLKQCGSYLTTIMDNWLEEKGISD